MRGVPLGYQMWRVPHHVPALVKKVARRMLQR